MRETSEGGGHTPGDFFRVALVSYHSYHFLLWSPGGLCVAWTMTVVNVGFELYLSG